MLSLGKKTALVKMSTEKRASALSVLHKKNSLVSYCVEISSCLQEQDADALLLGRKTPV